LRVSTLPQRAATSAAIGISVAAGVSRRVGERRLSITHNLGGLGSATDWQNLESKESLVIPC
jgi:hypothetical protein